MWGFVFPVLHRKAEIGICLHQRNINTHTCAGTQKNPESNLYSVDFVWDSPANLISCVLPKVLKNVIFLTEMEWEKSTDTTMDKQSPWRGQKHWTALSGTLNSSTERRFCSKVPNLLYHGKWKTSSVLMLEANLPKKLPWVKTCSYFEIYLSNIYHIYCWQ